MSETYFNLGTDGKRYPDPVEPIYGEWGAKKLRELKKYIPEEYQKLVVAGELNAYLNREEEQRQDMIEGIVRQLAQHDGVTEELKNRNPMEWVGLMNNYRHTAEELLSDSRRD